MKVKDVLYEDIKEVTAYQTPSGRLYLTKEDAVDRILWARSPCSWIITIVIAGALAAVAVLVAPLLFACLTH